MLAAIQNIFDELPVLKTFLEVTLQLLDGFKLTLFIFF